jgi:hypothetical protein
MTKQMPRPKTDINATIEVFRLAVGDMEPPRAVSCQLTAVSYPVIFFSPSSDSRVQSIGGRLSG